MRHPLYAGIVLATLALLPAACSSVDSGTDRTVRASPSVATGASSGSTALSPALTITLADENKTEHVKVGQVLDLALRAASDMQNWQVQDADASVLQSTVNPAATAARGITLRAFKAIGAGTATIRATDRSICTTGQACPRLVQAFAVTIVVTG